MADEKSRQLEQELHHLKVINEFALNLLSLTSTKDIVWNLAHQVVAQLGFDDIVIYLYDEETDELRQAAAFGNKNPAEYQISDPIILKPGEGIVGRAASSKQSILIGDTRQCDNYIVDDAARLSEIAVPMVVEGNLIGVIDSEHANANFYSKQDLKTLESIGLIAGTKIAKSRIIETLQNTVEELEYSSKIQDTLFKIAEIIFETDDMEMFYQKLHQCISRLTYAKNFMVGILSEDKTGIYFPYSVDQYDDYPDATIPYNIDYPSISGWVVKHNTALLVTDKDLQKMVDKKELYTYGTLPKSWLGIPFGNESTLKGLVVVQNYDDAYHFTQQDKQLLNFAAKHIRNAIERMQAREQLKYLALHDPLTRLPNRTLFNDRIEQAILGLDRTPNHFVAVLFLDLDKFKEINDSYGHHVGDELLKAVSKRIASCLRQADTLCRLGGDEFAVLMEALDSEKEAMEIANRVVENVCAPIELKTATIHTSTSIGVSFCSSFQQSAQQIIQQADEAMYFAKQSGRNQVKEYKESLSSLMTIDLNNELTKAINNKDVKFNCQILRSISNNRIIGVETLINWENILLNQIELSSFKAQLNSSELGEKLDLYTCQYIFNFLNKNRKQLPVSFLFSIKIVDQTLISDKFLKLAQSVYKKSPEFLSNICFEISENILNENTQKATRQINMLRAMGAQISLSDFGVGHTSLSILDKFNIDSIKIGKDLVNDIKPGIEKSLILTTVIKLARTMGINVAAEGIENSYQYEQLKLMKCDIAQGDFIQAPLDLEQLVTHLE